MSPRRKKTKSNWGRISESLRYFLVGVITAISATDVLPETKVKYLTLGLGIAILALKSVDMAIGIQPKDTQPQAQ